MLIAQAVAQVAIPVPFFPPWYFWVFVLAVVFTVAAALVALVFLTKRSDNERMIKERELAAHLIEVMLTQRKMSPEEIDQVLNCYWRLGTFWYRFRHWIPAKNSVSADVHGEKIWQLKSDSE